MLLKELFEMIQTTPLVSDAKIFMLGASIEEDTFNCVTNAGEEDMFKFFYALYRENEIFRTAIDAVRAQIDSDLQIQAPAGSPVNTIADNNAAMQAIDDAMKELNAIYVKSEKVVKS